MAGSKKGDPEERIRELEAKIRRLEEKLREEGEERESEGVAGGLLREIGGKFGLGGLIKGLEKSAAFQERLKMINEEVERRLREEPLKRVDEGRRPLTRSSFSVRTLADREPVLKKAEPIRRVRKEAPKELAIDVFEEEEHLKVIAELLGVEEKDIRIDVEGDRLTISTDVPHHRYHGEVTLPYPVKGEPKIGYKKGILEIRLEKA